MASVDEVLVAYDGTPLSEKALAHALDVYSDASITVLHVIDYIEESYTAKALVGDETLRKRAQDRSEDLLTEAEAKADEHDQIVKTASEVGKAADEILEYADTHGIDVIVIGSHGRSGVARMLMGSVAETVMKRASVPVTVVR
ncbi:universal stress protein [Haloplanus aerogenes]|uniref:Nucleotide-binding universal stress UspA family protein n=1 Tax=Haloplanus aerogenes TaxID=660522 RepID=A0A3M0D4F6_9EURY|nr:universal stress protein [Haloplanus aerogenes]AZH24830.1 universal stress protein [Haloplanus aerogenes]RMB13969.1 nucleotide-binding universal stress UspA family protein [Haloplanus aerogenes]